MINKIGISKAIEQQKINNPLMYASKNYLNL